MRACGCGCGRVWEPFSAQAIYHPVCLAHRAAERTKRARRARGSLPMAERWAVRRAAETAQIEAAFAAARAARRRSA